jgi:hypothetical protein
MKSNAHVLYYVHSPHLSYKNGKNWFDLDVIYESFSARFDY